MNNYKPTVLHLLPSFHQGGSERQALQLARLLCEEKSYNVRIAAIEAAGMLRADAESLATGEIAAFPLSSFYDANMARQTARFIKYLRANKIDVVQTHDFYTNIFALCASRVAGVRGRIGARRESPARSYQQRAVERMAYRCAQTVVANCDEVRRQLIDEGVPSKKIVTVYNGLDTQRVVLHQTVSRADALRSFGLPTTEHARFVTIVANLRLDLKDHENFLRAARQVREHCADAHFVLAGEGELMTRYRDLADELGLKYRTHFIGRCERVAELLAVSSVCVLSSYSEGFSNSILEYMAAARPVVVTDTGGAREAVRDGENGFVVPVKNSAALAEKIVYLLHHPAEAEQMGRRGREIVEAEFSTEAQLTRTLAIYEKLLSTQARTSLAAKDESYLTQN